MLSSSICAHFPPDVARGERARELYARYSSRGSIPSLCFHQSPDAVYRELIAGLTPWWAFHPLDVPCCRPMQGEGDGDSEPETVERYRKVDEESEKT